MFDLFRGFRAVFFKETLHVRRDPSTLFFSLVIPLLQMVVLGLGIDTNIRQVNTVVFNADGRRESRELIDRLEAANIIEFTSEPPLPEEACRELPGCHGAARRGEAWQLRVDSLAEAVPQLITTVERHEAKLVTLSTHAATLEDLFVSLTGRELRDA